MSSAWPERRLKYLSITPIVNGVGAPGEFDDPSWPRYVRITDIADRRHLKQDIFKSQPPVVACQAEVRDGDLLLAAVGATFGISTLYRERMPACFAGYLVRVRPRTATDADFLTYWTESTHYWDQLRSEVIQATIQNFSAAKYRRVSAPWPDCKTRENVVRYLEPETARIDALIDRKQRFIDLLLEKRTALITHAVTKGLNPNVEMKDSGVPFIGDTPAHWEVGALRRWWNVIDCKHRTVAPASEGVPMVSIGQVQNVRIDCSDARLAGPDDYSDLIEAGRDPRRGDVVYSRNASVGLVSLLDTDERVCLGQDVCMLRSQLGINGLYLTYQLRSYVGAEQLRALQRGPTFNRINVGIIRTFVVGHPPADEQVKIASFIEKATSDIDVLMDRTRRSIDLLREYRAAIISAAVTGQIDIADTDSSEDVA